LHFKRKNRFFGAHGDGKLVQLRPKLELLAHIVQLDLPQASIASKKSDVSRHSPHGALEAIHDALDVALAAKMRVGTQVKRLGGSSEDAAAFAASFRAEQGGRVAHLERLEIVDGRDGHIERVKAAGRGSGGRHRHRVKRPHRIDALVHWRLLRHTEVVKGADRLLDSGDVGKRRRRLNRPRRGVVSARETFDASVKRRRGACGKIASRPVHYETSKKTNKFRLDERGKEISQEEFSTFYIYISRTASRDDAYFFFNPRKERAKQSTRDDEKKT